MAKNNEDWEEVPLAQGQDDWQDVTSSMPAAIPAPQEAPGYLESAGRGAAQGLSFGFADELQAGAESLFNDADYDRRVKEIRDQYKAAADENPITYHGADILSGFALPIGAIGGFAKGSAKAAKALELAKKAESAGNLARAEKLTELAGKATPTVLQKIGMSAGSGAILGGLAGAGTSEADDTSGILKDSAIGAGVGAVAGPVIEGAATGVSKYVGKKANEIGAIKDIFDFFKYGKQGVELTGPENLRKITAQGKDAVSTEMIPQLEDALKLKNTIYEGGKEAADAAGKTVSIKHFEDLINKAEAGGADPAQIEKLRRELGIIGKREQVAVTDPAEYQQMYRDKVADESQKLKEAAYKMQMRNAEKVGQGAYKEAERANKEMMKTYMEELRVKYPGVEQSRLKQLAETEIRNAGVYRDPSEAAQTARDKVIKEAEEMFGGQQVIADSVTGQPLASAQTGANRRVLEPLKINKEGDVTNNMVPKAALDIQKTADKNAAYAYALAERENTKAIDKLAGTYREKQIMMSRSNLVEQLKKEGKWVDPQAAANQAKEQTKLLNEPIDIERAFSPQINRDVLTARSGQDELISKILPKFEFTKEQYQKPDLGIRDVETFRNFLSDMTSRDKQLDFRSLDQLNAAGKEVRSKYNEMLGEETAKAALDTDRQVRRSLAEMGVDSLVGDSSIENKINLRDQLAKLMYKANTAKGANESVKLEEAFKGLRDIYKNNPDKVKEVESAFASVKDKMRQAHLSDITTGHNTFAIDPTSINWTMTAGGKIGMVANEAGLMINKIANAPVGKLLAQSKKLGEKGYKKYSAAFEKMSSTDDINKRRALMYTLLQDPGFRQAMSADIMGEEDAGK